MNLPKCVVVTGMVYTVTEVEDLKWDEDTMAYGMVLHTVPCIKIEATLDERVKLQSLVHEMMHALFHQTGHSDFDYEEQMARLLGCQLPTLLRENRELVHAILDS